VRGSRGERADHRRAPPDRVCVWRDGCRDARPPKYNKTSKYNLVYPKNAFEVAKANLEKAENVKQKVEANFAFNRAKARFQVVKVVNKLR
jgi:hypothetical protein